MVEIFQKIEKRGVFSVLNFWNVGAAAWAVVVFRKPSQDARSAEGVIALECAFCLFVVQVFQADRTRHFGFL